MRNREHPQDYSEEDLELYRNLGFDNIPGKLHPIIPNSSLRKPKYISFNDPDFFLTWQAPLLWFASENGKQSLTPEIDNVLNITETLQNMRSEVKNALSEAEKLVLSISNLDLIYNFINPNSSVAVVKYGNKHPLPETIKLADIVGATFTSTDQVLDIANSEIFGTEGALQKLANMVGKVVSGKFNDAEISYSPKII